VKDKKGEARLQHALIGDSPRCGAWRRSAAILRQAVTAKKKRLHKEPPFDGGFKAATFRIVQAALIYPPPIREENQLSRPTRQPGLFLVI